MSSVRYQDTRPFIHLSDWRLNVSGVRVLGTEFPTLNVQVDLINIVYFVRIFKKTDRVLMASHCIWETPNTREILWKTWVDAPYRYTKLLKSNAQNKIVRFHYSDVTRALWRLRSPDNCLLNSLFKLTRKKQHSASLLASCEGNPLVRSPVDSLHRGRIMSWRDHDFKDMMYMYFEVSLFREVHPHAIYCDVMLCRCQLALKCMSPSGLYAVHSLHFFRYC